jgi:hypothetical protein
MTSFVIKLKKRFFLSANSSKKNKQGFVFFEIKYPHPSRNKMSTFKDFWARYFVQREWCVGGRRLLLRFAGELKLRP